MRQLPAIDFLGLRLISTGVEDFLSVMIEAARERRQPIRAGYLNAATFNLAFETPELARAFRQFEILYADGQAVVGAARWLGKPIRGRINAGDFTEPFFRRCAQASLRIALIGGREGEAAGFARAFERHMPGLAIVHTRNGYFSSHEFPTIMGDLEKADPDIVLVGMGSPRQESFVMDASSRGRPRVWWCVGALFEYASGSRRRAPVWMRKIGLEWLFRLALEPRRLARRYLIGNPLFVYRVLRSASVPVSESFD